MSGRSHSGSGSSSESIDFDNLPEDLLERFELLGIDPSLLDCGEDQLIKAMEMSAIDEMRKNQEERRKAKEARKKEQKAAEEAK